MSTPPQEGTTVDVTEQLAQLTDLFRRRLLDDRRHRQVLETQQVRIDQLQAELAGDVLVPLLRSLRLVIDRARAQTDPDGFGRSIAEEVIEALAAYGIDPIDETGPLDPLLHEVVESEVSGGPAQVVRVVSVGFRKGGRTLVPARVAIAPLDV